MKIFFLKIYFGLILLATDKPSVWEKIQYLAKLITAFAPVIALLEALNIWFTTNSNFIAGVMCALSINMMVGLVYHKVMKTFSWYNFFVGNIKMFIVVFLVYILLELLRFAVGNNIIGEGFKIIVQTTTILYPVSKSLKNIYVLTQKKFPPSFIMERLYNFEKSGNIKELFDPNDI